MKKQIFGLLLGGLSLPAFSWDWNVNGAQITYIEGTYMPSFVAFQADMGSGACPAGATLIWNGQGSDASTQQANVKAIYAMLLVAKVNGQTVNLYGDSVSWRIDALASSNKAVGALLYN